MKNIFRISIAVFILAAFVGTLVYLYQRSQASEVVFETEEIQYRDLVKKTMATGSISPKREVAIKSRVSGIVDELYVEPGEVIKAGQLIAKIRIIPNIINLNNAQAQLERSMITFQETEKEYRRQEKMYKEKVISETEFLQSATKYKLAAADKESAENNLQLVKNGASKKAGQVSNLIYTTSEGTVLDVPVKKGSSVIESNNFNEGTTICSVANMLQLQFKGNIDESEAGKIHEGMPLNILIGAVEGKVIPATLDYIAPKGTEVNGSIQFEVRASIKPELALGMRAGYSANAEIVLASRKHVLSISEGNLKVNNDSTYVERQKGIQKFDKLQIKTGLSDGLYIEVIQGLKAGDKIKKLENAISPGMISQK